MVRVGKLALFKVIRVTAGMNNWPIFSMFFFDRHDLVFELFKIALAPSSFSVPGSMVIRDKYGANRLKGGRENLAGEKQANQQKKYNIAKIKKLHLCKKRQYNKFRKVYVSLSTICYTDKFWPPYLVFTT
jgi:hypothetical protein